MSAALTGLLRLTALAARPGGLLGRLALAGASRPLAVSTRGVAVGGLAPRLAGAAAEQAEHAQALSAAALVGQRRRGRRATGRT
ncbi:MAG TPA: hypothetical protein VF880_14205, partial [Actinomycetes bacterium]